MSINTLFVLLLILLIAMKSPGLFLVVVCLLYSLQSCDSTYSYADYDKKTLSLCLNEWAKYTDKTEGRETRQILRFHLDGTGEEQLSYMEARDLISDASSFEWRWLTGAADTLYLQFNDKQIFYFKNISINYNLLHGIWNDQEVCFHAIVK